jgi:2-oxoglutarate dehydrogenase E2 component (dihydrolipoamide succinyltransferase)
MIIDVLVPSPGESVTEVILANWLKANGEFVNRDEKLADIESDKTVLEVFAEASGVLTILVPAGPDPIAVGTKICMIDTAATAGVAANAGDKNTNNNNNISEVVQPSPTAPVEAKTMLATQTQTYTKGLPSVSAERMIAEKGLLAENIIGTGLGGRITKADVIHAAQQTTSVAPPITVEKEKITEKTAAVVVDTGRSSTRTRMSNLRKTLAARLVAAKNDTAMLTTFNEVDMTAIMELRKKYKDKFKEVHDVGLGFMSFFTKACCEALKVFPLVNSQIEGDQIVSFNYVDMGIAVSTDRGLMVPVVRDADKLSLADIEKKIIDLANRGRQNKISIDEMQGGTFTITNGGIFGSLLSTPILNPPQSAILGMHKIEERPIALNGQVVIRPMMYVALSYDHRIIDGKESVSFLVKVKELLEDPIRLLLEI